MITKFNFCLKEIKFKYCHCHYNCHQYHCRYLKNHWDQVEIRTSNQHHNLYLLSFHVYPKKNIKGFSNFSLYRLLIFYLPRSFAGLNKNWLQCCQYCQPPINQFSPWIYHQPIRTNPSNPLLFSVNLAFQYPFVSSPLPEFAYIPQLLIFATSQVSSLISHKVFPWKISKFLIKFTEN